MTNTLNPVLVTKQSSSLRHISQSCRLYGEQSLSASKILNLLTLVMALVDHLQILFNLLRCHRNAIKYRKIKFLMNLFPRNIEITSFWRQPTAALKLVLGEVYPSIGKVDTM